jgi:aconitate hydratase|tara:strand:+ start:1011 stop:3668 length:2658 start_codon:yes stop_codon:yes gene_type:complete
MSEFSGSKKTMAVNGKTWVYYDLSEASKFGDISKLPRSLKVLLEMLLRNQNHASVNDQNIKDLVSWVQTKSSTKEVPYFPSRVLMQDFTGVPAIVDLAAMRDGVKKLGAPVSAINPQIPVDLVIDHSISVEHSASADALGKNVDIEFQRNQERYEFLKWGQTAFSNFRVVPPGMGICHQVNIEFLAEVVTGRKFEGEDTLFPDTLVGTDSHTTMVNGLSVLGWGVGGIEAESALLGQPISIMIPEVVGFKLEGELPAGATATDLVLTVTQMLRSFGVVGKFVEFFGSGLAALSLADRATLANMAPEYGATCGFFPIDDETLNYLRLTGRDEALVTRVEQYAKTQGFWRDDTELCFTDTLELDMADLVPCIAGPKRPQDRVILSEAKSAFKHELKQTYNANESATTAVEGTDYSLTHGDLVIAAITSCTNTSNPFVMMGAGLVAQKAVAKGLTVKPWVKTSLAPGSQVVSEYLHKAGLQKDLDALGFNVVGYGCTTCIGNSGPLADNIQKAIEKENLVAASVLSGNRNFEGRINPHVRANYLASPPLVVAYAIAGSMLKDINNEPLGQDTEGKDVFLHDIWPTSEEINEVVARVITPAMFNDKYASVFEGDQAWKDIETSQGETYDWNDDSTYIANPPFFEGMTMELPAAEDIKEASLLALLGDSVTTDHISPAGAIKSDSPAGLLLSSNNIGPGDFNSYGSRRGNHNIMMRGTFANIRIKNEMVPGVEGGFTKFIPTGETMPIFDAAMKYVAQNRALVVVAGKEYGTGSSRDWAAKGTDLLGVKAVIAESFERIHRSNLAGMGVLPLQFNPGDSRISLGLKGDERISVLNLVNLKPRESIEVEIKYPSGEVKKIQTLSRLDTADDVMNYQNGGILPSTLRKLAQH